MVTIPSSSILNVSDMDTRFPDNAMVVHPGLTRDKLPHGGVTKLSYADKVKLFENTYRVWIFDFAELFAKGENNFSLVTPKDTDLTRVQRDSAFSLLAILNPYFDLIGKLAGDFPLYPYRRRFWIFRKYLLRPKDFIKAGIIMVFPDLAALKTSQRNQVVNIVYGSIRNPIAHTGLIGKQVILSGEYSAPLSYGPYKQKLTVVINSIRWYDHLRSHFDAYVAKLKASSPKDVDTQQLQARFDQRFLSDK